MRNTYLLLDQSIKQRLGERNKWGKSDKWNELKQLKNQRWNNSSSIIEDITEEQLTCEDLIQKLDEKQKVITQNIENLRRQKTKLRDKLNEFKSSQKNK